MDDYECNREVVIKSYDLEVAINRKKFRSGDVKTSCEYIFQNQKEDASNIIQTFYTTDVRVISIVKRTKVGMDGLMIEIAMRISTHINDEFMVFCDNVFFVTGMSNISWENDMKEKTPSCFKDNIHHHGKLHLLKTKLKNVKNALIIIDEIDTGDKENQKLHSLLEICDILDMMYMEENNIRFIFVSATMVNELKELCKWGDKHTTYSMTIPKEYIGHKDFLEKGLIQEFYKVDTPETAEKWIQNDILQHYGDDYRVHIIRTDKESANYINVVCNNNNIAFKNHTSVDRISDDDLKEIFGNITKHVVIAVKGFYRRANLIPNAWKMKIGATHERFVAKYDTNVQVQGLPGRMSGYWRTAIENGHKTGPHRTSINAIKEYEAFYENPLGNSIYNCAIKPVFLNPNNIRNLDYIEPLNNTNTNIPIQMMFNNISIMNVFYATKDKQTLHTIIIDGFKNGDISLTDKNIKRFDITSRTINTIRMYKLGDSLNARRFKTLKKHFESSKSMAQTGNEQQYNIDCAKDTYEYNGCVNNTNVAWITYRL